MPESPRIAFERGWASSIQCLKLYKLKCEPTNFTLSHQGLSCARFPSGGVDLLTLRPIPLSLV